MIKNVIFDLGRVVLDFKPEEYLMRKFNDKEKVKKLMEIIFGSSEWIKLDEGTLTEEEAIEKICLDTPELEDDVRKAFDNWYPLLKPIESTIEIIKELKNKGYNVFFLSNFHDKAFKYVNREYPFFKLFDGGVVSYKERIMKPNPDIYKLIIERYDLIAEESIFIDDVKENVQAAEKVGIKGINLIDPKLLDKELKLVLRRGFYEL